MQLANLRGPHFHFTVCRIKTSLFNVAPVLVVLALIWPFGGGRKVQMTNAPSVPGATGVINIGKDSNGNTKLQIQVKYLAQPSSLTPAKTAYVVWIQASGHEAKDQGVLKVGTDRSGTFETVTPYDEFVVFVTAENSPQPAAPSGEKVLTANVSS